MPIRKRGASAPESLERSAANTCSLKVEIKREFEDLVTVHGDRVEAIKIKAAARRVEEAARVRRIQDAQASRSAALPRRRKELEDALAQKDQLHIDEAAREYSQHLDKCRGAAAGQMAAGMFGAASAGAVGDTSGMAAVHVSAADASRVSGATGMIAMHVSAACASGICYDARIPQMHGSDAGAGVLSEDTGIQHGGSASAGEVSDTTRMAATRSSAAGAGGLGEDTGMQHVSAAGAGGTSDAAGMAAPLGNDAGARGLGEKTGMHHVNVASASGVIDMIGMTATHGSAAGGPVRSDSVTAFLLSLTGLSEEDQLERLSRYQAEHLEVKAEDSSPKPKVTESRHAKYMRFWRGVKNKKRCGTEVFLSAQKGGFNLFDLWLECKEDWHAVSVQHQKYKLTTATNFNIKNYRTKRQLLHDYNNDTDVVDDLQSQESARGTLGDAAPGDPPVGASHLVSCMVVYRH